MFRPGQQYMQLFDLAPDVEILDASGATTELPDGEVCIPIRFWAVGSRLDRIVFTSSKERASPGVGIPSTDRASVRLMQF